MKAPGGRHMNGYDTYIPPGCGRHSIEFWFQCIAKVHKDLRVYASIPVTSESAETANSIGQASIRPNWKPMSLSII